jgi:hypothetical protein
VGHFPGTDEFKSAKQRRSVDFSFYLEVAVVLRIIETFDISVSDWVVIFVTSVPVMANFSNGNVANYQLFGISCTLLFVISLAITRFLWSFAVQLLKTAPQLEIANPNDILDLVEKAQEIQLKMEEHDIRDEAGLNLKVKRSSAAAFMVKSAMENTRQNSHRTPKVHKRTLQASESHPPHSISDTVHSVFNAKTVHSVFHEAQCLLTLKAHAKTAKATVADRAHRHAKKGEQDGPANLVSPPSRARMHKQAKDARKSSMKLDFKGMAGRKTVIPSISYCSWMPPLSEWHFVKITSLLVLLNCFYVSLFVCIFMMIYVNGAPSDNTEIALYPQFSLIFTAIPLLLNFFIVMPFMMFLGFAIASVLKKDEHAIDTMGKMTTDGVEAAHVWENLIVTEVVKLRQANLALGPEKQEVNNWNCFKQLFDSWALPNSKPKIITRTLLRNELRRERENEQGVVESGYIFTRPELIAMMRIVDKDRSGTIGFVEFAEFCEVTDALGKVEAKLSKSTAWPTSRTTSQETSNPLTSSMTSELVSEHTNDAEGGADVELKECKAASKGGELPESSGTAHEAAKPSSGAVTGAAVAGTTKESASKTVI